MKSDLTRWTRTGSTASEALIGDAAHGDCRAVGRGYMANEARQSGRETPHHGGGAAAVAFAPGRGMAGRVAGGATHRQGEVVCQRLGRHAYEYDRPASTRTRGDRHSQPVAQTLEGVPDIPVLIVDVQPPSLLPRMSNRIPRASNKGMRRVPGWPMASTNRSSPPSTSDTTPKTWTARTRGRCTHRPADSSPLPANPEQAAADHTLDGQTGRAKTSTWSTSSTRRPLQRAAIRTGTGSGRLHRDGQRVVHMALTDPGRWVWRRSRNSRQEE